MLTKKEADKFLKEIKGEARGQVFQVDWDYVNETWGEKGIKKLENRMLKLGHPLKYEEIKTMYYYPLGLYIISLLSIKDIFNLDDKAIKKMGMAIVKFSFFTKIFLAYFPSLRLLATSKEVPRNWRRHYTLGDFQMSSYSEKKKSATLTLKDFKSHPVHCALIEGYFAKLGQLVVKSSVTCKETKCMFKGDPYHELLLTW